MGRHKTQRKERQLNPPRTRSNNQVAIVSGYVQAAHFDNVEFVRVRWNRWNTDPNADTWEPTSHMVTEIGRHEHDRLMERLHEQRGQYTDLSPIVTPGSRLGNDGSDDAADYFFIDSLWDRYVRGNTILYRVHWFGYPHTADTFEPRDSLLWWIGEKRMRKFEDERNAAYQTNPTPILPDPIHTGTNNILGGISMGYTRKRRFLLTQFVQDIESLQESLGLWARRHTRHLNEWTTNRVRVRHTDLIGDSTIYIYDMLHTHFKQVYGP